jgi:putative Mg2+ transporter-C (MgtC) family protein
MLPSTAVLAGNTLLRPLANWINRRPITAAVTETNYRLHVVCGTTRFSRYTT